MTPTDLAERYFEAMRDLGLAARVHIAGSSEEYGLVHPDEVPIREDNPLRPLSPYAVSKVTQDLLAYQYWRSYRLHVVRTRGFNHTGPRRGEVFVTSNFARQVAEIEKGVREPIVWVGNLESVRDFTDVRDVVRAYRLAVESGEAGEVYNIGSGMPLKIGDLLERLLALSTTAIQPEPDPARQRPADVPVQCADTTKFRSLTGWTPQISFDVTLRDSLDAWRARVRAALSVP